jgi:ribonuclease R
VPKNPKNPKKPKQSAVPNREELIAFIKQRGGKVSKRDIARAFRLDSAARAELKAALRELRTEGELSQRRRRFNVAGHLPAVVLAEIVGRDDDGDLIAEPAEWDRAAHGSPPKIRLVFNRRAKAGPAPGIGDRVLLRTHAAREIEDGVTHEGSVLKVIDKAAVQLLGIFRARPNAPARLVPVDKKSLGREIEILPGAENGAQDGDLVSAELASKRAYGLPQARVREKLGSLKSERAVSLIAIHAHGIPNVFPRDTLAEAERAGHATLKGREDWRHLPLVTIDPPDAKDHDDAVFAEADPDPNNKGGHIVTVAIADVAHYVTPGSALDRTALERGNSVYFPDRVVPMLPEAISNDLCSLREKVDRPALAARMVISHDGRKLKHSFHRIMMKSAAKLSYRQAQDALDGKPDDATGPLMERVLNPLFAAYQALAKARDARQPLALDIPERKLVLKPDGTLDRVITPERMETQKLIEEYMILANVASAETCEQHRVPLLYRVHDAPALEKVASLREFLQTIGQSLSKSNVLRPGDFNRILDRFKGKDTERLVHEVVLRSQAQAEYASINYGHFGLQLKRYAHFTSPIRRYADLIVHRAIIRALGLGKDGLPDVPPEALAEIGAKISATERRAMAAERETVDRLVAHFLADRVGATFQGRISGVTRAGLFVKLDETGADGFVPARTIGADFYRFDERHHALIGERTREAYRLGDRIEVKLVEAIPVAGALRFEILSEGRYDIGRRGGKSALPPRSERPKGKRHKQRRHQRHGKRK